MDQADQVAVQRAAEKVRDAWRVPGPAPHLHQREQERLKAHWPALARAVDQLAQVVESGAQPWSPPSPTE